MVTTDDRRAASTLGEHPEPEQPIEHESGLDRLVVAALVGFSASLIAAFWVPTLSDGLMTDELLSAWVSSEGVVDAVDRAFTHQGNSPLYFVLLWAWRAVVGSSELMLRLPSVLCIAAAAYHLARLGIELDGGRRLTGVTAAFVLLANTDVMLAGVTARPYALLLLSVVVSARALVHFLHDGRWRCGLVWVLAAGVSMLMSPFAALVLPAHLVVLADAARGRRITPFGSPTPSVDSHLWQRRMPGLLALGALATSPLVPQALALARRSQELVLVGVPDVADLVEALVPVPLLAAVA
ncbi:MAG: glycosyltransferase family 39 protein, partial [Acidimicrobiales bacterium]